jgi:hypothetical protein
MKQKDPHSKHPFPPLHPTNILAAQRGSAARRLRQEALDRERTKKALAAIRESYDTRMAQRKIVDRKFGRR